MKKKRSENLERLSKAELIKRLRDAELRQKNAEMHAMLVHELEVHQEEVRIQNEQLRDIQQSLENSRDRYADLYDFAPIPYVTLDGNGMIVEINLTGASLFELDRTQLVGRPMLAFISPEDRSTFLAHMLKCRRSDEDVVTELTVCCKKGNTFPAQLRTHRTRNVPDGTTWYRTAINDLTELRRAESEKQASMLREHAARAASEMKDEFIAVVSHELRTPLAAILMWSKMLTSGTLPPDKVQTAAVAIEKSAEAQRKLIDDLLDMSRMLTGKTRLQFQDIDIISVVRAAIDTVRPMAEAKQIQIDLRCKEQRIPLRADPDRIQQIVWNLLSNAVKFSDSGSEVQVTIERHNSQVRLQVADTGVGISTDFLPHVFERFRQADASANRAQGGLGLGLAITRQLVELHGGSIRAESAGAGMGSTFIVQLPSKAESDGADDLPRRRIRPRHRFTAIHPDRNVLSGMRILLVDDDYANRSALQLVLNRYGAEVTAVGSAMEALQEFNRSLSDRHFHLVLSDIGMPGKNGYEMIREMREVERERHAEPVPAVALTAYVREEDRQKALKAGFHRHVPKPMDTEKLLVLLAELAGQNAESR